MSQSKGLKFSLSSKKSRRRQSRAMVMFLPCENINKIYKAFSKKTVKKEQTINNKNFKNFLITDSIDITRIIKE